MASKYRSVKIRPPVAPSTPAERKARKRRRIVDGLENVLEAFYGDESPMPKIWFQGPQLRIEYEDPTDFGQEYAEGTVDRAFDALTCMNAVLLQHGYYLDDAGGYLYWEKLPADE